MSNDLPLPSFERISMTSFSSSVSSFSLWPAKAYKALYVFFLAAGVGGGGGGGGARVIEEEEVLRLWLIPFTPAIIGFVDFEIGGIGLC